MFYDGCLKREKKKGGEREVTNSQGGEIQSDYGALKTKSSDSNLRGQIIYFNIEATIILCFYFLWKTSLFSLIWFICLF